METTNRKAFTMIELVFVIVIIGILAAVALPKLAATRDDAKISQIAANARTLLTDFQSFYAAKGATGWQNGTIGEVTAISLHTDCSASATTTAQISPTTFSLCHETVACLTYTTIDEGNLTVADGSDTSDPICEAVKAIPSIKSLSNKSYQLAGQAVVRR